MQKRLQHEVRVPPILALRGPFWTVDRRNRADGGTPHEGHTLARLPHVDGIAGQRLTLGGKLVDLGHFGESCRASKLLDECGWVLHGNLI